MGDGVKRVMASEQASLVGARRGLAVSRDLPAGHVLSADDFTWLRPRESFGPRDAQALIGKVLKVGKAAGTHLVPDDLAG